MQILRCFIFPSAQSIILPSAATDLGVSCDSLVSVQRFYAHTATATETWLKCSNIQGSRYRCYAWFSIVWDGWVLIQTSCINYHINAFWVLGNELRTFITCMSILSHPAQRISTGRSHKHIDFQFYSWWACTTVTPDNSLFRCSFTRWCHRKIIKVRNVTWPLCKTHLRVT